MSLFNTKEFTIDAFGGKVKFRELTFGEAYALTEDEKNDYDMAKDVLIKCMVDPELTEEDVESIPASYADDIKKIVSMATGNAS